MRFSSISSPPLQVLKQHLASRPRGSNTPGTCGPALLVRRRPLTEWCAQRLSPSPSDYMRRGSLYLFSFFLRVRLDEWGLVFNCFILFKKVNQNSLAESMTSATFQTRKPKNLFAKEVIVMYGTKSSSIQVWWCLIFPFKMKS